MLLIYKRISGLMVALWVLGTCVAAYFHWRISDRIQQDKRRLDHQFALLVSSPMLARLEPFASFSESLAAIAQFADPRSERSRDVFRWGVGSGPALLANASYYECNLCGWDPQAMERV